MSPSLRAVDLRVFADEELVRELARVPRVASVNISGGVREEVQVNLDLQRLQAVGLGINDVLSALRERNLDTAGGRIRGGETEPLTRLVGRFQDVEAIRNLLIPVPNTSPPQQVYLRDVATITDGTEEQRIFVMLNGEPAVKVSVQKQAEANTVQVVAGVKARIEQLKQSGVLPADLVLTPTLDESRFIQNSIRSVITAGLSGAGLAAIAVLLFLGSFRQTLIIVIAIPLATLTALLLMGVFNLSLNVFSLGGLALGVRIVVDNAIIMVELANQIRDREQVSHTVAILKAAPQRFRPILMTTITTVLGLFPLALGLGEGGEFLQPLGIVVFSGLSLAALLTLFIIPCFYTLLHEPRRPRGQTLVPQTESTAPSYDLDLMGR
ncbi:efflux RND transporter permease subunit [Trichothermofontia sp.]